MNNIRRYLALLLALVMALSLSVGVMAYDVKADVKAPTEPVGDMTGKTVILHSNDVHGAIAGYAYIAGLKTAFEAAGAEVILTDSGDFTNGDPYVSLSKGESAIEMMNAVGYDVATLGNHEFDFTGDQMKDNLAKAKFKVICANVVEDGKSILDPTFVYTTKSGLKIGFFGMETPETATKVHPSAIQGFTFLNNIGGKTDLFDCAQAQVDALKAEGVDLIVALTHLGVYDESAADGHRSVDLYNKISGVDIYLDGHSHSVMTAGEKDEPIQSTGTKFANVGVVVIDNASKKIESHYLYATQTKDEEGNVTAELPKDEAVAAAAKAISDKVDAEYGAPFAKSEVQLNGVRSPGNRDMQTNNGNLITEAMLWQVLKDNTTLTVDNDHTVAITNGGGIRAAVEIGDVTMKDINAVLPFGNTIAVVYVTGAELLEALEASTFSLPIGGYPQTTGIKWTLDTTKEYDANAETYPDSTYYGPKSINRVSIESINGQPFDPAATYGVVTNDFCAAGGDTYYAFKSASAQFDTGIPMDAAVVDYIKTELNGVIGSKYATDRGDLTTILPAAEPEQPAEAPAEQPAPAEAPAPAEQPAEAPAPVEQPAPAGPVAPAPAEEKPVPAADSYTVVAGDYLWKISQKLFGTGKLWSTLFELNKDQIKDPNVIHIGQVLKTK